MRRPPSFIDILLGSRPYLIVGLSAASGYTTFLGLELYVRWWPVALILTVAVQSLIVIGTLQLTMAHWRASARRVIGVIACLFLALGVSIFFSYFAFYQRFESENLADQKFANVSNAVVTFADSFFATKRQLIAGAQQSLNEAKAAALSEALGQNGQQGKGPKYRLWMEKVASEQQRLNQLEGVDDAQNATTALKAYVKSLDPARLAEAGIYAHLHLLIVAATTAEDAFMTSHGVNQATGGFLSETNATPTTSGLNIMSLREYQQPLPSLHNLLRQPSPLAVVLAILVDLFTIFLTFWLESVPFGRVAPEEREAMITELMSFSEWKVNKNNELEFRLIKTESERSAGFRDGRRLFWVSSLLNRGLLRRVDPARAEFTPKLYRIFIDYFYRRNDVDFNA